MRKKTLRKKTGRRIVHRVYTEREPCILVVMTVKKLLANEFPETEVTYSVEYGDKASRDRGNAALVEELKKLEE
ncbi:nucleic acid/nucleotide deaminase domain-containing protein [Paenibacillus thiaminolyticus]|uniref:nucleic acid/nucleotide deaminase domain-containing protein n=1 Tax=Paenibacillus thiaminolyticus TaxID=49283 RepID=UPI0030B9707D